MLKEHPTLKSLCGNKGDETELDMSGKIHGEEGAIMLVAEIVGNRAMTSLDVSNNQFGAEGTKLLATALKGNQVMTELNIASNMLTLNASGTASGDMSGVIALADAIPDMGALTKFDTSDNALRAEGTIALAAALKGNQTVTALNISSNRITSDGQSLGHMAGVTALTNTISDMGALLILNMSKNDMKGAEAGKALGDALATNTVLKELDLSGQPEKSRDSARPNMDVAFVKAIAPGLSDNRAMTSLNLSDNKLGPKGAEHLAEGIKVINCVVAVICAPFSCPSDHWFNCCCLLLSTG
jgi:Ran GTPase-activating protein (RanGAP) involved in mRNA processing and transport